MSMYPIDRYQKATPRAMAIPRVEKSSTSRVFHALDADFYWLFANPAENTVHECFIAEQWHGVWMEMLQLTAQHWKQNAIAFEYESSLSVVYSFSFFTRSCHGEIDIFGEGGTPLRFWKFCGSNPVKWSTHSEIFQLPCQESCSLCFRCF